MTHIVPKRARFAWLAAFPLLLVLLAAGAWWLPPVLDEWQARQAAEHSVARLQPLQEQLNDFVRRTRFLPNSNLDAGLPEAHALGDATIQSIQVGHSALVSVTFTHSVPLIGGQHILFVPEQREDGKGLRWRCDGGDVPIRFHPQACRFQPAPRQPDRPLFDEALARDAAIGGTDSLPALQISRSAQTARQVLTDMLERTRGMRQETLAFYASSFSWPTDNRQVGAESPNRMGGDYMRYVKVTGDGGIEMRFNDRLSALEGHRFWLRATLGGQWRCDTSLPDDHLPVACQTGIR